MSGKLDLPRVFRVEPNTPATPGYIHVNFGEDKKPLWFAVRFDKTCTTCGGQGLLSRLVPDPDDAKKLKTRQQVCGCIVGAVRRYVDSLSVARTTTLAPADTHNAELERAIARLTEELQGLEGRRDLETGPVIAESVEITKALDRSDAELANATAEVAILRENAGVFESRAAAIEQQAQQLREKAREYLNAALRIENEKVVDIKTEQTILRLRLGERDRTRSKVFGRYDVKIARVKTKLAQLEKRRARRGGEAAATPEATS